MAPSTAPTATVTARRPVLRTSRQAVPTASCTAPSGYVATATDCDDTRITVYPGATEVCADGLDNNCDTFFDCADSNCAALPACQVVEICNNTLDDDGDGLVDCLDSGCAAEPSCAVGTCLDFDLGASVGDAVALDTIVFAAGPETSNDTNTSCGGAVSSDRGYLWRAPRAGTYTFSISDADYIWIMSIRPPSCTATDYLCAAQDTLVGPGIGRFFRAGEQTLITVDGLAGAEGTFTLNINPSEAGACTDATDNDGDRLVDCNDSDCAANAACPENCTNGVDDDANTLVDCVDPDCRLTGTCCIQDPLENNDAIATATPIAGWQARMGTAVTVSTGDDDFYAVPVCAGVSVAASVNFVNANGNIDLELRNATGASVLAFSRSLSNNSETISYNAVRTETLFLRATMAGALACSSYTYNFTVSGSCP